MAFVTPQLVFKTYRDSLSLLDVTFKGIYVNMADIKSRTNLLLLQEETLREGVELLYFAYRDFTAEPDAILAEYGFGRAHHRVIHFVGRNPRMTVSELLAILKITKQSLSRVLGQLVREGFIVQHEGTEDRRQRLLELTSPGVTLERRLSDSQKKRFAEAYRNAGAEAVEGYRKVLMGMISEEDRERVLGREQTHDSQ
tara:strand:- start:725 stop:1318 length:594 start_codon:yes stop_codon:yes gene_type:complete